MASTAADQSSPQVVFIDGDVPDLQGLLSGLAPGVEAFVIDPSSDGLKQIASILAENDLTDVSSISIVGHGASGQIQVGTTTLDADDLSTESVALSEIGDALAPSGELQLYSCDTANGTIGQQFIADLSSYIGAPVAASTQDIGQTAIGENWTLDAVSDSVADQSGSTAATARVPSPFTAAAEAQFSGTLSVPTTEMWVAASSGGSQNLILHADDTGTHTASNIGTLFTPVSANNPSIADGLNGIDLLQLDPQNEKYFIATQDTTSDEVLEGSLSRILANPTATPTYTTLYSNSNAGSQGYAILGLTDDPASQQVFFIEGHSFYKVSYAGGAVTTLDNSATAPFLNGLALDLPHHIAYFINSSSVTTTTTTKNGQPDQSDPSGNIHYHVTSQGSIYETSTLNASSGTNSVTVSKLTDISSTLGQIGGPVGVPGFTVDTTTGLIYFSTQSIGGQQPEPGGIFWIDPTDNTHTVHTLFRQNTATNDLLDKGLFNALQVDHATGLYYVSLIGTAGEGGAIYVGSLTTPGTPTLFETIPTYNSGTTQPAPEGLSLDNAPTLTATPSNPTFTESASNPASSNNTPVTLITSAAANDTDNTELISATVAVSGSFSGSGDSLFALDGATQRTSGTFTGTNITVSETTDANGNETLTFTGTDSFANYQTVLEDVRFTSTSENPTNYGNNTSRTLSFTVSDGLLSSAAVTSTVTVIGTNDSPVISVGAGNSASIGLLETNAGLSQSKTLTVTDPDDESQTISTSYVSETGSTNNAISTTTLNSYFSAGTPVGTPPPSKTGTITYTFNSGTEAFNYLRAGQSLAITYNIHDVDAGTTGTALSTDQQVTVTITGTNDTPSITSVTNPATFTEAADASAQVLSGSGSLSVSDLDVGDTFTASVTGNGTALINGGAVPGGFAANIASLLSSSDLSFDTGDLSNGGTQTINFTYSPTAANLDFLNSTDVLTVTFNAKVNDGTVDSTTQPITITINGTNDAPVITSNGAGATATISIPENTTAVTTVTATDVDEGDTQTYSILSDAGTDFSKFTIGSSSGVLSFTSPPDFENPTDTDHNNSYVVDVQVSDGHGGTATQDITVDVTNVNEAPAFSQTFATDSYTENGAAVSLLGSITLSDPDNPANFNGGSLTVTITNAVSGDELDAVTGSGLTISSGEAFLNGTDVGAVTSGGLGSGSTAIAIALNTDDTPAEAQALSQAIGFDSTSDDPTGATRNISVVFNDGGNTGSGGALTGSVAVTMDVTAVNDAPTVSAPASYLGTANNPVAINGISFGDVDAEGGQEIATFSVASGALAATASSGITLGGTATALTATGTIANLNSFISGNHLTFTGTTSETLTISIDDQGNTGAGPVGGYTVTTTANLLFGPEVTGGQNFNETEGASTGTIQLATFTDTAITGPMAGNFTATIDWGDGTGPDTTGTIADLGGGTFAVDSAGHTYAEEKANPYQITVTVTDTHSVSGTATDSAQVADAALTPGTVTLTGGVEGVTAAALSATFTDGNTGAPASDFSGTIDWGDTTSTPFTSADVTTNGNGSFTVSGLLHLYAEDISRTVSVTVNDVGGQSTTETGMATIADAPLTAGTVTVIGGVEGVTAAALSATFTDANTAAPASDFSGTINWGDTTSTPFTSANVTANGNGSFTVSGINHLYAEDGSYNVSVAINDIGSQSTTDAGTAAVGDALLSPGAVSVTGGVEDVTAGTFSATFSDANIGAPAGDFSGAITWGDGSQDTTFTSSDVTANGNGTFTISGTGLSHLYTEDGTYSVSVAINDKGGSSTTDTGTTTVGDALLSPGTLSVTGGVEDVTAATFSATFSDANTGAPASDFSGTIDWGDTTSTPFTSADVTTNGSGSFTVSGLSHLYSEDGSYNVTVAINDAGSQSTIESGTTMIADAPLTAGNVTVTGGVEGVAAAALSASFTDANTGAQASDFSGTINWGDTTSTPFTSANVTANGNGSFTVSGINHLYAEDGSYNVSVAINDIGSQSTTDTGTATVADAQLTATDLPVIGTEGTALNLVAVANFTDANPNGSVGDFSATIDWGDGTTGTGTVVATLNGFQVEGSHLYTDEGAFSISTSIADQGGSTANTISAATIGEGDVLTGQSLVMTPNAGQASVTAVFSDIDTVTDAGDFSATINWGDGTPATAGTVSGGNGTFTVTGLHSYAAPTPATVTVTLVDDPPGTATGSFTLLVPATPVVTAVSSTVSASASETFTPAQLFSATEAEGFPILSYEVEDETVGGNDGFWVLNGTVLPNGQITTLTAAQLSQLSFVAGSASTPLTDTLEVAASDSAGFGPFTSFTVTSAAHASTSAPTVTAANEQKAPDLTLAASSLFSGTAFGGSSVVSYEVEDITANSGHWVFNGVVEPANQLVLVTAAQLSQLSFDTGYGSDTLMVRANDGSQWGSFTSFTVTPPPNAAPPAGTKDTLVMLRNADGAYEFYDIGQNKILLDGPLGQINPALQVAGVGGFDGSDTADLLMRDPATGAFTLYDVSNNNITGNVPLGQVGPEWTVAGVGDFSTRFGETDMLMRNSNSGAFEVYDISNNAITFSGPMGQVGLEWTVAGFGDFSTRANETDMLMRNSNTGAFEVYDISNNTITSAQPMGQVGLEWQIAGFGDFSTRPGETDMLLRNSNTGAFEVYDIVDNTITSAQPMGQVGLEWTIAGFGNFSGNANETDMLMRNSNSGVFTLYDIGNNTVTGTAPMGQVGLEWSISGVSASVAGAPPNSAAAQLTQAMASFAPSPGTSAAASPLDQQMGPAPISTTLLTTNHA